MATDARPQQDSKQNIEMDLAGAPSFIEHQFPVAKVSMESYKERKANHAQTLTGLGKWWGRKPLVLVRATVLGLLLPATDNPRRDQEIFLKLMTMDDRGLGRRKNAKLDKEDLLAFATESEIGTHLDPDTGKWLSPYEIAWNISNKTQREKWFSHRPERGELNINKCDTRSAENELKAEARAVGDQSRDDLEFNVFYRLPYLKKLKYCARPEEIDGPEEQDWAEINAHFGTSSTCFSEFVEQLGLRRFGHRPRVGDSFCGAGSIPFESARIGCDVYASDLSPVAALLTWAALNIVGGGPEIADELQNLQRAVLNAVDKQVTEWGIEHNEKGWRADAFLYCVEVDCPECEWRIPLAPSWVIGEKTRTIAELVPDPKSKRFEIEIRQGVKPEELKAAKVAGTVGNSRLICPNCNCDTPIDTLRQLGRNKELDAAYHESGLRLWENNDLVPRSSDVYQERMYCIRWVETYVTKNAQGEDVERTRRWYKGVDAADKVREEKVLELLQTRFKKWQQQGYIPRRKIEPGQKTTEPIRTRGWTYWHHLFTPRQLLCHGSLFEVAEKLDSDHPMLLPLTCLFVSNLANRDGRIVGWVPSYGVETTKDAFNNRAVDVLFSYAARGVTGYSTVLRLRQVSSPHFANSIAKPADCRQVGSVCDFWITDPPYADAVNYHELSEYFLAWYDSHLTKISPDWYADSKRPLAVKGEDPTNFKESMVECYHRLVENMTETGAQVVMFTHQDAAVWADLTMILWAAGLRVTSAWCIATETDSALKQGNYVQGTVLLICRKRTEDEPVFLDEINHKVELEVREQLDHMTSLDDDSDPNFGDADYQLAAYAAALRVITERPIEDIDPQREVARALPRGEVSPIEEIIRNAVKIACDHLVPKNIDRDMWKTYSPMERFYLKGLEVETHGERRSGVYQELARGFGALNYDDLLASTRANETRLKSASEFGKRMLSGDAPFAGSLTRHVLYAVHTITKNGEVVGGINWLKTELPNYWDVRVKAIVLLDFFAKLDAVAGMEHWKEDCESARLLAGALRNDHG